MKSLTIYDYGNINKKEYVVPKDRLFLGKCKGVALVPRGKNDNHICTLILTEDDGNWFCSSNYFSGFWLDDLKEQIEKAKNWIIKNAIVDVNGVGFNFRG